MTTIAMRVPVLLFGLIAGCASLEADLDAARRSWHDARYEDVVMRWGAPSRSTTLPDDRQAHTWDSVGGSSSGMSIGVGVGTGGSGVGVGVGTVFGLPGTGADAYRCERTLFFKDGRVVEQTWLGPARYCSSFRKE